MGGPRTDVLGDGGAPPSNAGVNPDHRHEDHPRQGLQTPARHAVPQGWAAVPAGAQDEGGPEGQEVQLRDQATHHLLAVRVSIRGTEVQALLSTAARLDASTV